MYAKNIVMAVALGATVLAVSACQQSSEPATTEPAAKSEPVASVAPPEPKFERPAYDASAMDSNVAVKSACFVAAINSDPAPERFEVKAGAKVALEGWTADVDFNVPESIALIIKSSSIAYEYPATLGPDHSRAAEVLKKPQLANAGYTAELDLSGVQPGEYSVFIKQTSGGSSKYCLIDNRQIVVSG